MSLEKVTCFPNEGTPEVIPGDPVLGDIVRVVGGHDYFRFTPEPPPYQPTVEQLKAQLDELNAKAAEVSEKIADLTDEVAHHPV